MLLNKKTTNQHLIKINKWSIKVCYLNKKKLINIWFKLISDQSKYVT